MIINQYKNKNDLKDFLISLDNAVKNRALHEELNENLLPKMFFSTLDEYEENNNTIEYERPLMNFRLEKRGPASASTTDFFIKPHKHQKILIKNTDEYKKFKKEKDNQIIINLYVKSQKELLFFIGFIERVFAEEQEKLFCSLNQIVQIKEHGKKDQFFKLEAIVNVRTIIHIKQDKGDKIKRTAFLYKGKKVAFDNIICKYYNYNIDGCQKQEAERKEIANDVECRSQKFCKQYKIYEF